MTVIGFRQLGRRCNGRSRANEIVRELTFSIAIAMPTRYRLALLTLISALYIAVFSSLLPVGHSREDFVVRLDSQRTLPKVKVTGRRGGGFSFGYLSLNMGRGGSIGFNPFYNLHNQSDLEAKCEGAGHDNPACLLLCEIFPHSWLCWRSFGTITVTGQRETPYNDFTRYEIRNGVIVFTSEQKEDEDEKQKEQERKELENLCEKELSDLFSDKEDLASAFGVNPTGPLGQPTEEEEELIEERIEQLVNITKPIMTTGINGYNNDQPVDYTRGQEASNGIYIDKNGIISRGKALEFGTRYTNLVETYFKLDDKYKNPNYTFFANFHTHTSEVYVWPSPHDIYKHITSIRDNEYSKTTPLAIGFKTENSFRILILQVDYSLKLFQDSALLITKLGKPGFYQAYGKYLEYLFDISRMIIIGDNSKTDYLGFFEKNPINKQIRSSQFIPSSCVRLIEDN